MKNLILILALAVFASCQKETITMEETVKRQNVSIRLIRDIEEVPIELDYLRGYGGPIHDYEMHTYVTVYRENGEEVASLKWLTQQEVSLTLPHGSYTVKASTYSQNHEEPLPTISDCLHFKGETSFEVDGSTEGVEVTLKHDYAAVVISDLKLAGRDPVEQATGTRFYVDYIRTTFRKGAVYGYLTGREVKQMDTEDLFGELQAGKEYRIWSRPDLNEVNELKIFVL